MGYDDHGTAVIDQKIFQPCDRLHIEVVGRLVKQDQIRLCEQKLAKGNPCFLSAGEGIDLLGKFVFRKSKPF